MMSEQVPPLADLYALLPANKCDTERAQALVDLGYPSVAPILPELMTWLQDMNWPVAHVLVPFLETIGPPLLPEIRHVLATDDGMWKYWVLLALVQPFPAMASALRPELVRLVSYSGADEDEREVSAVAQEILATMERVEESGTVT